MESREDFYFDDSDNPGSDATIEKEEHYKWTIALEEETKEDAGIPEEDLLEQAEPEAAERLILKRDLRKAAIARMEAAARTQGDFEDVIDAWDKEDKNRERRERYHEVCYDALEEAERNVYRKGMECFGGIAPTYHIELLDKPTIAWDFHSLMLAIQMKFSFMITDENSTLKLCKHCGKIFVASRSNVQFCSPQCKNQYNVYKSRAKKEDSE